MSDHVLVVDDDAAIRRLVRMTLETEGIEVTTARDGDEALRSAIDDPPALVVLDIMMPRVDGWTVCEQLRSAPGTARTPVVLLTALARDEDLQRGRSLGAVGYVTKPFDVADLVDIVHEILATA